MGLDWNTLAPGCIDKGVATLNCLPALLTNVITGLLAFSGAVAVFFIIFSGIKLITSGGEAKQVEDARKTLTYAVAGLIVILLSFFIINLISYVTNVECIKKFGFTNCDASKSSSNGNSTGSQGQTQQRISPRNRELNR